MSKLTYNRAIGLVLEPEGFVPEKGRRTWRRLQDGFLDEINLQLARAMDEVTVNYAIRHEVARQTIASIAGVGRSGSYFTIFGRLGDLVDGRDRWWLRSDPSGPADVADLLRRHALPYFARMHTVDPYIEHVTLMNGGPRWTTVAPRLELAVLLQGQGRADQAQGLLQAPPERFGEFELERIKAVERHLTAPTRGA